MELRQKRVVMDQHQLQAVTGQRRPRVVMELHQQPEAMEHQRREAMGLHQRQVGTGHLLLVGMVNERGVRTENNG